MRIYVDKVLNESVYFSTGFGKGKGIWKDSNKPVEKEYFVEFDIDILYDYEEIIISKIKEYKIKIDDEKIYLTLLLLEYDEYGCTTFRFGDSIIEVETNYDERFLTLENTYVTICIECLNIYNQNI